MSEPIAVVGVGCILPDAFSPAEFWQNLLARKVSLVDVPASRWNHSLYFSSDRSIPDKTYAKRGGFVEGFHVDWRKFKIPPADAEQVNPLQWMVLEAGFQALSGVKNLPGATTGVIIGSTGLGWQRDQGLRIRLDDMLDAVRQTSELKLLSSKDRDAVLEIAERTLAARLKEVSEDNVVGASASVAAGRINMHFDLKGPHYSIDAGFASSLAAVDMAVRGLRDGELDVAVTGGVSELLSPLEMIAFAKLGALGSGDVRPFDAAADGTMLGEGAVLFALRRLDDAIANGDTIYSVIRGVGGSSDGRGKSLVAPRADGQALAMKRAFEDAGSDVTPGSVGYVECHASGTSLGDVSEVRAMSQVYGAAASGSIGLGSVKANIGHLRSGSGAAGMLKAVLSLHHGHIPATPGVTTVSPKLELGSTPFTVAQNESTFAAGRLARAAVSAFSFGGNNFHVVLEAFAKPASPTPKRKRVGFEPMAIIGMGGLFPGAENLEQFWQKLLEGYDRTETVPKSRYAIENYYSPGSTRKDKSYTNLGCFLDALPLPDASMKIPPAAWQAIDPSHVLCLKSADEALRDAKYAPGKWDVDRVAVSLAFLPYQGKKFLADSRVNWNEFRENLTQALVERAVPVHQRLAIIDAAERRYKSDLPHITEDTLTGYLGSLNAGRICSLYDFHGPHFVVDAACASAHAALHAASKMLSHREADVVLSGGVWCDMRPEFFIAACRFNALSANGSFPFDARADGFIPGEGAGIVVLKRLADAERDHDSIRAVVRAIQGSSDGKGRSVLAPSREGEGLAMRRAIAQAGVPASSVEYVECHGTGTALGDVVEANAVGDSYGSADRAAPISIGSVKSNIGHLNAAAGVAGMVKAAMCLERGIIPASIKVQAPNPKIPASVQVVREQRSWASGPDQGPRRAGVSAFGVGGANYHAILEEYRPRPAVVAKVEPATSVFAGTGATLKDAAANVSATGHAGKAVNVAITAKSTEELERKRALLATAIASGASAQFLEQTGVFVGDPASPLRQAKIALMLPGQGGQYANMLRPLAARYPVAQQTLDEADAVYTGLTGRSLTGSFFTDSPETFTQRDEDAHASVFTVNIALARVLEAHDLRPSLLIGQSAGELAALVIAGSLSFADGLKAIWARTAAVLALETGDPGVMVALGCSCEAVPALLTKLPGYAALAADNGPKACIVSVSKLGLRPLLSRAAEQNIEATQLAVSHGYHSKLIADARPAYRRVLEGLAFSPPRIPIVSTIDGKLYDGKNIAHLPAFLASQFVQPVQLRQALLHAHEHGARVFLEAGPKWSLTQFARETLKDAPHGAMASIHPKVGELEQLNRLLAFCSVHVLEKPLAATAASSGERMPRLAVVSSDSDAAPTPSSALMALPLENVLEPLTARKIAAALGARFGVDTSAASLDELSSFERIVTLVERLAAAPAPVHPVVSVEKKPVDLKKLESEVRQVLLANMVAKTGYPAEMLTEDLDLEADLGIDTVKQVEIFSKTREHFGVPRDPNMSLRDFNTVKKVIEHLRERIVAQGHLVSASASNDSGIVAAPGKPAAKQSMGSGVMRVPVAAAPVQASPGISAAEVQTALIAHTVKKTGYPAEMLALDLDLEADLGIDTVKQVEIFAKTREQFGIDRDPAFVLRDFNTLGKFIGYVMTRAPKGPAPAAGTPAQAASMAAEKPAATAVAPVTVRSTLLSMSLAELGLSETEKQKLAKALASRLGVSSPNVGGVTTLNELVTILEQSGKVP